MHHMALDIPTVYPIQDLTPPFPSVDWLSKRLNAGVIPGSKIGRQWYMSSQDVADALDVFRNVNKPQSGITAASRRRRAS